MKQDLIMAQDVIETPRMILRPVRTSDAGLLEMYCADKRVAEMTSSIPHPYPPGAAENFIANIMKDDQTSFVWVMDATGLGGSELLGLISLDQMDRNQSEIGY